MSTTNITLKVSSTFAEALQKNYEDQIEEGIPYKGEYYGKVFEESFEANQNNFFSSNDRLTLYETKVEELSKQVSNYKILALVSFFLLLIIGFFFMIKQRQREA